MARPVSIDEKTLLDVARAVFLEKGFSATTAEVAERAGVSEGILFHRFGSKKRLFNAAMTPDVSDVLKTLGLEERAGVGDLETTLGEIVVNLIEFLRGVMPCLMMSWSNRAESGLPEAMHAPNPPPLRILRALTRYFAAEIAQNRMRAVEPEVLARVCMGGAMEYVLLETIGKVHGNSALPLGTYARGVVDILLRGALVTPEPTPAPKPRRQTKG